MAAVAQPYLLTPPIGQTNMAEPAARPKSALARGVQITQFSDGEKVNPEPVAVEETDILLEEYLSPRRLRALTGVDNLDQVHYLEMKVDTTETSLGNFGTVLPSLSQLRLSNSIITSVRDLGSCFEKLRVLWMPRCCLSDLDGLSAMSNLRELYLAYNEVSDISNISMLDKIEILDLEGNNLEDIAQIGFLAICSNLKTLTLEGNPICLCPSADETGVNYDYRQAVKQALPNVTYLDDEPLVLETSSHPLAAFNQDWDLINEMMKDVPSESTESVNSTGSGSRPKSGFRPPSGYRPGSALRPPSATKRLKSAAASRPVTAARPGSANRPGTGENIEENVDASELTVGTVVCGNPSKALRSRRKVNERSPQQLFKQYNFKPEHTYETLSDEEDENLSELVSELKQWRTEHAQRAQKIEEERKPQVLTLDLDDVTVSDSSDEEELSVTDDLDVLQRDTMLKMDDVCMSANSGIASGSLNNSVDFPPQASPPEFKENSPHSPLPPSVGGARMKAGHVRARRFRLQADSRNGSEESPDSTGETVTVEDLMPAPPPSEDSRPYSGPTPTINFKKSWSEVKNAPKDIDISKPVIRTALKSPEKILTGPRANTAKAAVGAPPVRIRRQLPKVPTLPSRPVVPK